MPPSNFVPRAFGFVHRSIAIVYHEVQNPNITIRNLFIAVGVAPATCCGGGVADKFTWRGGGGGGEFQGPY
jgi:hypothetical protein